MRSLHGHVGDTVLHAQRLPTGEQLGLEGGHAAAVGPRIDQRIPPFITKGGDGCGDVRITRAVLHVGDGHGQTGRKDFARVIVDADVDVVAAFAFVTCGQGHRASGSRCRDGQIKRGIDGVGRAVATSAAVSSADTAVRTRWPPI